MFGAKIVYPPCFAAYASDAYTVAIHGYTGYCFSRAEQDQFDEMMRTQVKEILLRNQEKLHSDVFRSV